MATIVLEFVDPPARRPSQMLSSEHIIVAFFYHLKRVTRLYVLLFDSFNFNKIEYAFTSAYSFTGSYSFTNSYPHVHAHMSRFRRKLLCPTEAHVYRSHATNETFTRLALKIVSFCRKQKWFEGLHSRKVFFNDVMIEGVLRKSLLIMKFARKHGADRFDTPFIFCKLFLKSCLHNGFR